MSDREEWEPDLPVERENHTPESIDPSFPADWEEDSLARNIVRGISGLFGVGVGGLAVPPLIGLLSGEEMNLRLAVPWIGLGLAVSLVLLLFAIVGGSPRGRDLVRRGVIGATVLGGTALFLGMLAGGLMAPDSGQGPLFGILMTGPAGAAAGALLGILSGFLGGGRDPGGRFPR